MLTFLLLSPTKARHRRRRFRRELSRQRGFPAGERQLDRLVAGGLAASMTEAPALAIVAEPIAACDAGNLVSPSRTVTFSGARPSASAATCRITV